MGCCQAQPTSSILNLVNSKSSINNFNLHILEDEINNQIIEQNLEAEKAGIQNGGDLAQNENKIIERLDSEERQIELDSNREKTLNGKFPVLELSIVEGKYLPPDFKITITPFSINGVKINQEKFTFGKKNQSNQFNFPNEESVSETQFEIWYDKNKNCYRCKDIQLGTGLFVNIKAKACLEVESIISFCNAHMHVNKIADDKLKIKFLQGLFKDKTFIFDPIEGKHYKVGRSKTNDIAYKEDSVSRVQCTFVYEKDKKWTVFDGAPDKPSSNGIWILAAKGYDIYDGMYLKTGNTTFSAKIISVNE